MGTQYETSHLAHMLLKACERQGIMATTAESCTGGLIISAMTDIAGSSAVVDRGFITYSNDAKMEMLGVQAATLEAHGAVSSQTAQEMASGALSRSHAGIALAVTGIAGPDGGSEEKPVGLIWFGLAVKDRPTVTERYIFDNNGRDFIRRETVRYALIMALNALGNAIQADGLSRP